MADQPGGIGGKVINQVGAKVVRQGMRKGWKAATGDEPPVPGNPDAGLAQAIAWTALSAAAVAVVQLLIRRHFAARSEASAASAD